MNKDIGASERIRIGPSGWGYEDWKGRVYPTPIPRGLDRLAYLVQYCDTIEITRTFYTIPSAAETGNWAQLVSGHPTFRFTAKCFEGFTDTRNTTAKEEAAFRAALAPLHEAGQLGAVVLQFPFRFHFLPENLSYLRRMAAVFGEYPLVLDISHRSWDRPEAMAFLVELGMGFTNTDQPAVSYLIGLTQVVTSATGYLRLSGRNASLWVYQGVGSPYDYRYQANELQEMVEVIERISRQATETYVITNNRIGGQSVVNALELRSRLRHAPVQVPPPLLEAYPELRQIAAVPLEDQA